MADTQPIPLPDDRQRNVVSRRRLLAAAPIAGAALAVPAIAAVPELTRAERIERHAEALLALIRGEFPENVHSMSVTIGSNWGPDHHLHHRLHLHARAARHEWVDSPRLRGGGLWTSQDAGDWFLSSPTA